MKYIGYLILFGILAAIFIPRTSKTTIDNKVVSSDKEKTLPTEQDNTYRDQLREELVEYLRSGQEVSIKDARWENSVLTIALLDDGTRRDGLTEYVCSEMGSGRYDGIFGNYRDILIVARDARNMKKLGESFCKKNY